MASLLRRAKEAVKATAGNAGAKKAAPIEEASVMASVPSSERFVNEQNTIDEEFDLKLQAFTLAHAEQDVVQVAEDLEQLRILQQACRTALDDKRINVQAEIMRHCEARAFEFAPVKKQIAFCSSADFFLPDGHG